MAEKILIIDDDKDMCLVLKRFLTKHGFEAIEANSGKKALEILEGTNPDLILCDFKLEDMDGTTILKNIKEKLPAVPVIIITGYSNIKTAVEVMRLGAIDYVTKPLLPDEILVTIKRALNEPQPVITQPSAPSTDSANEKAATSKKNEVGQTYIFGNSPDFKNILNQIDLVGPTNYSVIIYGESGSGKEAIAQEIHKRSKRADKPFIAIDCGALSKELAGSELFGHEKGSFTGAVGQKIGSFELANGGTILLDEIANLPYDVQVSLLRVTQERKMRRVGGTKDIDLDVRIIVASNEKLWDAARNGKFREDLYHRFNEFQINVPPLRERKNDVMIFARHFLSITNQELNKNVKGFTPEVETIFQNYVWHGNLRELKNVIKRATLLTDGELIDVKSIPFEVSNYTKLQFDAGSEQSTPSMPSYGMDSSGLPAAPSYTRPVIKETGLKGAGIDAEYEIILEALKRVNFNKSKAAKLLKIDRKTLYNKIKQYKELNNIEFQQEV
ncbi:sigma-54-dependent transcriptional regulator [Ohtaekwangia sp.]|uniref:sigma-54-dependent transcriptional regulator n=1 Tax=Ohtaekwangia sp. TaxID=2066019 RepID=UPI002F9414D9